MKTANSSSIDKKTDDVLPVHLQLKRGATKAASLPLADVAIERFSADVQHRAVKKSALSQLESPLLLPVGF